jgi:translation initiation factor eIF-2B subunit alpha
MVLLGAEGVVENGGVINKLGTYQIALCAKALGKPFYIAAESYKFARLYPLNQQVRAGACGCGARLGPGLPWAAASGGRLPGRGRRRCPGAARARPGLPNLPPPTPTPSQKDLPVEHKPVDVGPLLPRSVTVDNPSRDYTPPQYISLLVTDLGVLTPAAVSDELIQLYV